SVPADLVASIGPGDWVLVPWGRGRKIGIVLVVTSTSEISEDKVRPIAGRIDEAPPAMPAWLELVDFTARYYHRHPGEVMMPAVPKLLRTPPSAARRKESVFGRARRRFATTTPSPGSPVPIGPGRAGATSPSAAPTLKPAQADALHAIAQAEGFGAFLLHGVTGSGKTEVYLRFIASRLAADPMAQVLVLVPEIALTPQLADRVRARFPGEPIAILHSGLPEGDRKSTRL